MIQPCRFTEIASESSRKQNRKHQMENSMQKWEVVVVLWSTYWPGGFSPQEQLLMVGGSQTSVGWFCAPAGLFRKKVFGEPSSRRVPLLISDVESITSCFSGSRWEGKGEGSGNGNELIVFIVQRNSPLTFKAKTNSCEMWRQVYRSRERVNRDMNSTPLRQVQTQMHSHSNMSNNVLLALPTLFTLASMFSLTQTSYCSTNLPDWQLQIPSSGCS